MRKVIAIILLCTMLVLCACSTTSSSQPQANNDQTSSSVPAGNNEIETVNPTESISTEFTTPTATAITQEITDSPAYTENNAPSFIVKCGTLQDYVFDADFATIKVESWDLGYSQNWLSPNDEMLCIKFHVKNKTENKIALHGIFNTNIYIDGIEQSSFYCDFYGDDRSCKVDSDTKIMPGAETDVYLCHDCDISNPHTITIEICDQPEPVPGYEDFFYANNDVLETLEFNIE